MSDISRLTRFLNGVPRGLDLTSNSLVVQSVKIGAGNKELTEALMDKLIAIDGLTDANGRYTAADVNVAGTAVNISPASADVEAWLVALDAELSSAGSTEFSDDVFRINDDGDATKQIAFQASAISTATTRTISMPDSDVDLGQIATNTTDIGTNASDILTNASNISTNTSGISTNAGNISTNTTNISNNDTDIADLVSLSGVAANSTDLGTFTGSIIPDTQTIKQAFQSLEDYAENTRSLVQSFEWQDSALDYITDNTLAPPTEVSGDRYILSHDGGAPNAAWDGASAGDIVEFDGTSWIATTPTTGMFISVDDDGSGLYQWGGAAWSFKAFEATTASTGLTKVGFDIQLADAAENASGIQVSGGAITLNNLSAFDTDGLAEGATNLYFTDARARTAAVADSITDGVTNIAPSQNAVFDALALKQAASANLDEADTFFGATDISGAEAEQLTDGSNADNLHKHAEIVKSMVAGESYAANKTFLVRMAVDGETAGRVYKADNDASASDNYYVIGLVSPTAAVAAGENIEVKLIGEQALGSSDTNFAATDIGLPVYLDAAGAFTVTAPSAADTAIYRVGIVQSVSSIMINGMQLNGIN